MHRLFGKPKAAAPTPTLSDASTSINNRVAGLDEKIKGLDGELIKFKDQLKRAKGPAAEGIKRRALETLKRKKMYEQQRDQMAGQAFNVEQTAFAIETVKDTQTTVFAMKAAAQALKVENQKIDIGTLVVPCHRFYPPFHVPNVLLSALTTLLTPPMTLDARRVGGGPAGRPGRHVRGHGGD